MWKLKTNGKSPRVLSSLSKITASCFFLSCLESVVRIVILFVKNICYHPNCECKTIAWLYNSTCLSGCVGECVCVYVCTLVNQKGRCNETCMHVFVLLMTNKLQKITDYNQVLQCWRSFFGGGGVVFLVNDLASPNFIHNAGLHNWSAFLHLTLLFFSFLSLSLFSLSIPLSLSFLFSLYVQVLFVAFDRYFVFLCA